MVATWTPPENADPSQVLQTAVRDIRNAAYQTALEKFLWFHHHALELDSSLGGVRVSFALGYWLDLADAYPPAYVAFVRTRDEIETAFRRDPTNFDLFQDLSSFNRFLGDGMRTADSFMDVARTNPVAAKRLYHVAEPFLVAAGRFRDCGPFLDAEHHISVAARCYYLSKQHEDQRDDTENPIPKTARRMYVHDVATLLALLVINDRADEAKKAYSDAMLVLSDDDFRQTMDAAMTGHLPDELTGMPE